jgi:outer membrane biosynthesis protein TonB
MNGARRAAALAVACALASGACANGGGGAPVVVPVVPPVSPSASEATAASAPPAAPATPSARPALATPTPACDGKCEGRPTPELANAVMARGGQTRLCYNRALGADRSLRGKVRVRVRVQSDGSVCEARIVASDMPAEMTACLTQVLGGSAYPPPDGGCIDVEVPLSFEPQGGGDAGAP